jgi:hypothetical protein
MKSLDDILEWSVIDDEIEKRLAEVTTWLRRNATFHPDPDEMGRLSVRTGISAISARCRTCGRS